MTLYYYVAIYSFTYTYMLLLWQLFVMVAHNVKEDLWKGQQSGESTQTTVHIQTFAVCAV